jgi:hypothetical protein
VIAVGERGITSVRLTSNQLTLPIEQLYSQLGAESQEELTLSFLGQSVRFHTNSHVARQWAEMYLTPYCTLTTDQPCAEYWAIFLDDSSVDIQLPDQSSTSLALHYGKQGLLWKITPERTLIRELEHGDWYIIDHLTTKILYITVTALPDTYRDPARLIRTLMLRSLFKQGYLPLHGSAAALDGGAIAFLGDKQSGKTTMLMHLIDSFESAYISNDKILVKVIEGGQLLVYGFPLSCRLGFGTMRSIRSLAKHLHLFEHLEAATLPRDALWGNQEKLEFTPRELSSIMGCRLITEAPLKALIFPQIYPPTDEPHLYASSFHQDDSRLRKMLLYPDPDFSSWLGTLMGDTVSWNAAMEQTWSALMQIPAYSAAGGKNGLELLKAVAARLKADHLLEDIPTTPQPQQWLRNPVRASFLAILNHRREQRGMKLSPWQTRAIRAGDIHEFLTTPDQPGSTDARVDRAYYLGFAECQAGIIAVGDVVSTTRGEVGSILGFDETHAPNHLNIVIYSPLCQTGLQLGLQPGDSLSISRAGSGRPPDKAPSQIF